MTSSIRSFLAAIFALLSLTVLSQPDKIKIPIPINRDSSSVAQNGDVFYYQKNNNGSISEIFCVTKKHIRKSHQMLFDYGSIRLEFLENGYDLKSFEYYDETKKEFWAGYYTRTKNDHYFEELEILFEDGQFTRHMFNAQQQLIKKETGIGHWEGINVEPTDLMVYKNWEYDSSGVLIQSLDLDENGNGYVYQYDGSGQVNYLLPMVNFQKHGISYKEKNGKLEEFETWEKGKKKRF